MEVEKLVHQYLAEINIMQLATSVNDQPWACTVHYYSDQELSFYWISRLDRRHSEDIKSNQKVGATILVHENTPEEKYVIGVSISGIAELLGEYVKEEVGQAYVKKLGINSSLLSDIATGKNPHKFYRLKPSKIVLFDSKNFSENPRQELNLPS